MSSQLYHLSVLNSHTHTHQEKLLLLLKVCSHGQQVLKGPFQNTSLNTYTCAQHCTCLPSHPSQWRRNNYFPSEEHLKTVSCKMILYRNYFFYRCLFRMELKLMIMQPHVYRQTHNTTEPMSLKTHIQQGQLRVLMINSSWITYALCTIKPQVSRNMTVTCNPQLGKLWWSWTLKSFCIWCKCMQYQWLIEPSIIKLLLDVCRYPRNGS